MNETNKKVEEDAPANSVGGGGVAGVNSGETVVRKKKKNEEAAPGSLEHEDPTIQRAQTNQDVEGDAVVKSESTGRKLIRFKDYLNNRS